MCMAVPSRVIAIDGDMATVEAFGTSRACSLMLLPEPAVVGDYVILGAGGTFAAEIVPPEIALAALEYLTQVLETGLA
jgi:hydrogenase expression/formation protein HypC